MVNYSNGKIYKMLSDKTDKIYVGSTTLALKDRMKQHRADHRRSLQGNYGCTTSFQLLTDPTANVRVELLEAFSCASRKSLRRRERYYIKKLGGACVNARLPIRIASDTYYRRNRDKLRQMASLRYHKKGGKERAKAWYIQHRAEVLNRYKGPFVCTCGAKMQQKARLNHLKTRSHQKQLEQRLHITSTNLKNAYDTMGKALQSLQAAPLMQVPIF